MILSRTFKWTMDEDFGYKGWQPADFPNGNSFESAMVAHDILEHVPPSHQNRFCDELMALGASHYIRGETGWYALHMPNNINTPESHLAGSIWADIMREASYDRDSILDPGPALKTDADKSFREAISLARNDAFHEQDEDDPEIPLNQWNRCLGWMQKGYLRSLELFPNPYHAMDLFDAIGKAMERHADQFEGYEITVEVDTDNPDTFKLSHNPEVYHV